MSRYADIDESEYARARGGNRQDDYDRYSRSGARSRSSQPPPQAMMPRYSERSAEADYPTRFNAPSQRGEYDRPTWQEHAAPGQDRPRYPHGAPSLYSEQPSRIESDIVRKPLLAAPSHAGSRDPQASDISESLRKLALTSFYVRPGYGKEGRPILVKSNFFQVRAVGRGKIIYHYDVDMEPVVSRGANAKKPKGLLRAVWEQLCLEQQGEWKEGFQASAYDGRKNAFTPIRLPLARDASQTFSVAVTPDGVVQHPDRREESSSDDEGRRWKVTVKLVADIDLEHVMDFCKADQKAPSGEEECLTGLMATNVLMRDLPSKNYAQVGATGNKFFTMAGARAISQGAIVCRGFMQSFRYSSSGLPLLNLDIGFSAFLADGPALDIIGKILQKGGPKGSNRGPGAYAGPQQGELSQLNEFEIHLVKKVLRGAKFVVTHRNSSRLHTILSVTTQPADQITFNIESRDGGPDIKISIPDYYHQYHGKQVLKPRLPCVQYGKKAFIPLEFVNLAQWNSLPPTKLTAEQTAEMIKVSAVRPPERRQAVESWRNELAYEKQEKIKQWGLQVNRNLVDIRARILPPPRIMYGAGQTAMPNDGGWNLRGNQFFRNGKKPLVAWAVVSFDRYTGRDEMQRYVTYLCDTLKNHGVNVANSTPVCIPPRDPRQVENVLGGLKEAARAAYMAGNCAPQLICCVLPGRDAWLYETIKKMSFTDLHAPVPTQCMQAAKIRNPRGIDAYTGNLVMKIQSKLGGLTHSVPISTLPGMVEGRTMLLGGDLGLPPIKSGNEAVPTVACTIATYNAACDTYSAQIRLQEGRGEIIQDLSSMIEEHLKIFKKHNGDYPERVLIFRDGISEGQYAAALHYEHQAVLKACQKLQPAYRPRLLMCICAKRHNTRFFGSERDIDRSGNLPSGLVVDSVVTHPYAFDFFLQAHAGRVGTARPTHYICLLDELPVTPDQLQQLVHNLCHSFTRCTSSVSLVPVCYIADLVCQKARIIVRDPNISSVAPSESSAGRSGTGTRRTGFNIDVMQVQKVLEKNDDLAEVAWWM
ncbi:hypothetical protein IAU59_004425 [Kwoniella sp. CBS 9459]